MITPYKYRYLLGSEAIRTKDGKYQVYHNGKRIEIENREVEFMAPYDDEGNPMKLTKSEFNKIVEGTMGIIRTYGEFEDEYNGPKYEYLIHTWGGFYNDQYKKYHNFKPGYVWFDTAEERDNYLKVLKNIEETFNCRMLTYTLAEGFHTRNETVLHRVVKYKGKLIYSENNLGYDFPIDGGVEYIMEWKWTPGCNDYAAIDDESKLKDVEIIAEWITGAKVIANFEDK